MSGADFISEETESSTALITGNHFLKNCVSGVPTVKPKAQLGILILNPLPEFTCQLSKERRIGGSGCSFICVAARSLVQGHKHLAEIKLDQALISDC